jgi:DNA-binding beta-propeller fold protein YncE
MNILKTGGKVLTVGNSIITRGKPVVKLSNVQTFGANSPYPIAIDRLGNRVFIGNHDIKSVTICDYTNPANILATIPYSAYPYGIAIDGTNRVFVSLNNGSLTSVVYGTGVAVDPAGGRVFVASMDTSIVSVLNYATPTTGTPVIIPKSVGGFANPYGIAVDEHGGRVFVANSNNNTVSIVDYNNITGSASVITQAMGSFNSPMYIAIDRPNNRIFVTNRGNSTVSVLNYTNPTAGNPTVITALQGNLNSPAGIDLDVAGNSFWVANSNVNSISKITN